jgi:hypothetical protein
MSTAWYTISFAYTSLLVITPTKAEKICKQSQGQPLSCHSLIRDWLRKPGYVAGVERRTRSTYPGFSNFVEVSKKLSKKEVKTPGQQEIDLLRKNLKIPGCRWKGIAAWLILLKKNLRYQSEKSPIPNNPWAPCLLSIHVLLSNPSYTSPVEKSIFCRCLTNNLPPLSW